MTELVSIYVVKIIRLCNLSHKMSIPIEEDKYMKLFNPSQNYVLKILQLIFIIG
jgi:hypothetical protein